MNFLKRGLLVLSLIWATGASGKDAITLYSYQDYPPYKLPGRTDLTRELVTLINRQLVGGLQFHVQTIERTRLNKLLASGASALVIWTNPYWFQKVRADLLYSDAFFWNSNNFFSYDADAVNNLTSLSDLRGKKLLCIKGHFYQGIDDLVATGAMQRIDAKDFPEMMYRLKRGEADLALVNRSVLSFYQLHHLHDKKLYVARVVQDAYLFHILLTPDQKSLLPKINQALNKLKATSQWKALGKKYNVANQADMLDFDLNELMEFDQAIPEH